MATSAITRHHATCTSMCKREEERERVRIIASSSVSTSNVTLEATTPRNRWPPILHVQRCATYQRGVRDASTTTTVKSQDNRVEARTESLTAPGRPRVLATSLFTRT